jgi:uncharacterized protein YaiL (DUF2058 family)
MSMSLRDQLLQAGLITEKQAKEAEKKAQPQQQRKGPPPKFGPQKAAPPPRKPNPAEEARRRAAEKAQAAAAAQTQEREKQEREKAERKARRQEIKQLIEQHRVKKPETDDRYNFLDGSRIRRISVDAAIRTALGEGKLMIVRNEGRYEVVPAEIAERIRVLDERSVMGTLSADQSVDDNDPYKDYVVPDDLMW